MRPVFAPGDRVRVRKVDAPGHIRTPFYIRGVEGEIGRFCGCFRNPEEVAYGRYECEKRALYLVRFLQRDVWPDYRGARHDTVEIGLYEHWLEPANADGTADEPRWRPGL